MCVFFEPLIRVLSLVRVAKTFMETTFITKFMCCCLFAILVQTYYIVWSLVIRARESISLLYSDNMFDPPLRTGMQLQLLRWYCFFI